MPLIGYVRVSSLDQDTTPQLERVKSASCKKVFSEKDSEASTKNRTALSDCLEYMREGYALVITKIDRLARSAAKAKGKYTGRKPTAQAKKAEILDV